jgi:hypothetical protein
MGLALALMPAALVQYGVTEWFMSTSEKSSAGSSSMFWYHE